MGSKDIKTRANLLPNLPHIIVLKAQETVPTINRTPVVEETPAE